MRHVNVTRDAGGRGGVTGANCLNGQWLPEVCHVSRELRPFRRRTWNLGRGGNGRWGMAFG